MESKRMQVSRERKLMMSQFHDHDHDHLRREENLDLVPSPPASYSCLSLVLSRNLHHLLVKERTRNNSPSDGFCGSSFHRNQECNKVDSLLLSWIVHLVLSPPPLYPLYPVKCRWFYCC